MPLSDAGFAEAIKRMSSAAYPVLAVVEHPILTAPLYLTTEPGGLTSNGQAYEYFPFDVVLPGDGEQISRASVSFQNVSREIGDALLGLTDPAEITLRVVTSLNHDQIEAEAPNLILVNITGDAVSIQADLIVRAYQAEPWPSTTASQELFPGLWR